MKKKLIWFFSCFFGVVLVLVVLIMFAIASALSKSPDNKQMETLNYQAWFSANKKANQELNIINHGKNLDKERTVTFTKDEINSFLYMSINANNAYSEQENQKYKIEYANFNGTDFTVYIALKLDFSTPFGSIVNLKLSMIPSIDNDNFDLKIISMNLGKVAVPAGIVNYLIGNSKSELRKNESFIQILDTIKVLKVNDNSLIITYIPAEALKIISQGVAANLN